MASAACDQSITSATDELTARAVCSTVYCVDARWPFPTSSRRSSTTRALTAKVSAHLAVVSGHARTGVSRLSVSRHRQTIRQSMHQELGPSRLRRAPRTRNPLPALQSKATNLPRYGALKRIALGCRQVFALWDWCLSGDGSRVGVPVPRTGTNQKASASNQKRADWSSLRANVTASSNSKSIPKPASQCRSSADTPSAETNREPPRCRSARSRATRRAFLVSEA